MAPCWSIIPFLLQMLIVKILTKVDPATGKPTLISMEKNKIVRTRPPHLHMIMKCLIKRPSNVGVCDPCQVTGSETQGLKGLSFWWSAEKWNGRNLKSVKENAFTEMEWFWNLWRKVPVRQGCVWLHSTAAWLWHLHCPSVGWITEGHERDTTPHRGEPCTAALVQMPQLLHPYGQL